MTDLFTTLDPALLPSADDVASYHEHGFWISPPVVPDAVLDAAERGMERFYAGDHDAPFPGRTRFDEYDWVPEHGNVLRKNDYASQQVRELGALVRLPVLGAIAARLSSSPAVRLWHDQLLFKPVEVTGAKVNVGFHTDRQYWTTCSSDGMLTAWVPFRDCDEETGTITFVDGSHRWPAGGALDFFAGSVDDSTIDSGGRPIVRVPAALRRGQVSFHHCRTIHGSGPNRSGAPRRSVAVHMQTDDNRWRRVVEEDGELAYHRNDDLVRQVDGHPDYTDPAICPQLGPAPG